MARGNDSEHELRIALIHGLDAPGLRTAWDDLAAASATANIFYEPWAIDAAAALPEAGRPLLLVAWIAGTTRLAGLLPLDRRRTFGITAALQNWDQRTRALGEPLIRAGYEESFWQAAFDFLDRHRPGPYLRLSALIADSPSTLALRKVLGTRPVHVTRRYERALLRAGPSAAAYIAANIRNKVLKEQRRLRNRLAEQGGLAIDALPPGADAGPWIDDLFRLELTGWKGREGVAAAADPLTEHCFRDLLTQAHARGRLDFRRLCVGGKAIAMLANIEAGDDAFQLKIAYDEEYAAFSPGVLIEMDYLDHALDVRRLARVDSCARAGHPMIDRIWIDRLPIVSLAIPFDTPLSRLACAAMQAARRRKSLKEPTA